MKNEIEIPVPKEEDIVASQKRRENYASTRDMQAAIFNDAIAKRIFNESKNIFKCNKCGKEFSDETITGELHVCHDCR